MPSSAAAAQKFHFLFHCQRRRRLKFFDDFFKKFVSFEKFSNKKGKMIIENVLIRN
jgi:hypothetical protein